MSDVWTPPQAEVKDPGVFGNPDAPEIRRKHLSHEANIKAVGGLYYLGFIITALAAIITLIGDKGSNQLAPYNMGMAMGMLTVGGIYFVIGRGLRTLKPWSRIVAGILAGLGLLGFPFGTLISAFVLYLLFSKKGSVVFSEEYKQIIADTPDIKYRTSIIVWIFLGLLLVAAAFLIFILATPH